MSSGILLALLVIASCAGDKPVTKPRVFEGYGVWLDTILKTPDKIIRGLEPGSTSSEVRKLEGMPPEEEDSSSLYYELSADSITDLAITYQLDSGKVAEIEMMIRTTNDRGALILSDLTRYYQSKYSVPVTEKGIVVFTGKNSFGRAVKISLEDQSGVDDGLIYVLVYRDE